MTKLDYEPKQRRRLSGTHMYAIYALAAAIGCVVLVLVIAAAVMLLGRNLN